MPPAAGSRPCGAKRSDDAIVGRAVPPGRREACGGADRVRVEIPVEDPHRAARLVVQDGGVERQPDEHGRQQRHAAIEQPAMRDAPIQPGERRALERPADRDPLVTQLQRDGHGHERERRAGDERQTPEIAFAGRLDAEELPQQDSQHRAERDRHHADPPAIAAGLERRARAEEAHRARDDRREIRIAIASRPSAQEHRVRDEHRVHSRGECEELVPGAIAQPDQFPVSRGDPRDRRGTGRDVRPSVTPRQRENRRQRRDMRDEQRDERRLCPVRRADQRAFAYEEDRSCRSCRMRQLTPGVTPP